jgi:hypothetical protein
MSTPLQAPRPGSVTFVVFLTWVVALIALIGGVSLLLVGDDTLAELDITPSAATTYAWVEIGWGVIVALVAIGLAGGSGLARFLVTALMLVRIVTAVLAALALAGTTGFWTVVISGGIAAIILAMLWTARATAFFRTN